MSFLKWLWRKTKEVASKYTKIFIVVMFLNQLLFFGLCLNPICLVAAMPHVLFITVIIGIFWDTITGKRKVSAEKHSETSPLSKEIIRDELRLLLDSGEFSLRDIMEQDFETLDGISHYHFLVREIQNAEKRVIVLSGWLSRHVIDKKFLEMIRQKLDEGIEIYIGYGYRDSNGNKTEFEDSRYAINALKNLNKKFPNKLFVADFATHEKLFIVDEKKIVIGSANWLSNRKYRNSERSYVSRDRDFANKQAWRAISLVKANAL